MVRWSGIFFILILVFPFLGSWLWLQTHQQAARYDARITLSNIEDDENLVLWKFTTHEAATQLFWEHTREFEYKGEMYDIVRFEKHGDTTWYWCHHDRKESRVKKAMNSLVSTWLGTNPQQHQDQQRILDFLKTLYTHQTIHSTPEDTWTKKQHSTGLYDWLQDPHIALHTPPPEMG